MSAKRILYIMFLVIVAGLSALTGAVAGGAVVYQVVRQASPTLQAVSAAAPASNAASNQIFTINTTDIQTTVTQAAQKIGPAVVTVVGTLPGQMTFSVRPAIRPSAAAGSLSRLTAIF